MPKISLHYQNEGGLLYRSVNDGTNPRQTDFRVPLLKYSHHARYPNLQSNRDGEVQLQGALGKCRRVPQFTHRNTADQCSRTRSSTMSSRHALYPETRDVVVHLQCFMAKRHRVNVSLRRGITSPQGIEGQQRVLSYSVASQVVQ